MEIKDGMILLYNNDALSFYLEKNDVRVTKMREREGERERERVRERERETGRKTDRPTDQ